ncbi:MAG: histidine kinase [Nocardioidaceae bacterium]
MIRHPLAQFLAVSVLLVGGIAIAITVLAGRAANSEAIADARSTTAVLARSVAQPVLTDKLLAGDPGAIDRFDRDVLERLVVGDVRRIKIWAADGTIVYSDEPRLIQTRYELGEEEEEILNEGGVEAEVSDLSKPENRFEAKDVELVEVYTRVRTREGTPVLFEAYYSAAAIDQRKQEVFIPFQRIALGSLLTLLAVASPVIWMLTRRLTDAARDRERLLLSAIDASDAERRRIARDLHDGVVQDLAGTTFSLSAVARDPAMPPPLAESLERSGRALRKSLRSLRSLLVEIHPADLAAEGLPAALADLTAPAASAGIHATVAVDDVEGLDDASIALIWRVAQEAVRNAIRHSGARNLTVAVQGDPLAVTLEVIDDGDGFDPQASRDPVHYGLRGLESLVADAGATLGVVSAPGEGTTVRLEVSRR